VSPIEVVALEVLRLLEELGHPSALVGGLAVGVRARPRTTLDVDFAVAVHTDDESEGIAFAFQRRGYELFDIVEQTAKDRLATARFRIPQAAGGATFVDLLFASSGIEPEVVEAADYLEILPTVAMPVALRGHLLALKTLAHDERRRPQDRMDILALLAVANDEDLCVAHEAAGLITSRGFHRAKDLRAELDSFVREAEELRRPNHR
jgi:hypothetical protein